jgi:hypothetical protein
MTGMSSQLTIASTGTVLSIRTMRVAEAWRLRVE